MSPPTLKEIILPLDVAFRDPRAQAIEELKENKVKERDLKDYRDQELYDFKDRLKARRIVGRGPDQAQARHYKKMMLRKINAELRRRGLDTTQPDDRRCYGPGCARWQQAGGATK